MCENSEVNKRPSATRRQRVPTHQEIVGHERALAEDEPQHEDAGVDSQENQNDRSHHNILGRTP